MASRPLPALSAPCNVVRLPTAASHKVRQPSGLAVRQFREANPWPDRYLTQFHRHCRNLAESMTAAELVAAAVLVSLSEEQRKTAARTMTRIWFCSENENAARAADICMMAIDGRVPAN